ncbi:MAG TPA: hypothetical protein VNO21_01300, partial [Polyangiaceae bacterium]|nr:hypothetical protein [Polyangiaceae bacterium]
MRVLLRVARQDRKLCAYGSEPEPKQGNDANLFFALATLRRTISFALGIPRPVAHRHVWIIALHVNIGEVQAEL